MSEKFTFATWNINSIRARMHALIPWLQENNPTVLCLQETKCIDDVFPLAEINEFGYNVIFTGQKSYNGVAILSKLPIEITANDLPDYQYDVLQKDARYIEGIINISGKNISISSVYVPNGSTDSPTTKSDVFNSKHFKNKLGFLKRLRKRIEEISSEHELYILGGDYNVALEEIDLFNPKTSYGFPGFHDDEREAMYNMIDQNTYDCFRFMYPETRQYTWWDYRRMGWENDRGWRIDYLLTSKAIQDHVKLCKVDQDTRSQIKPSDHVPVMIDIQIDE